MFKINKFDCDYDIVKQIDAWGDVSIIFGVSQQNLLNEVFNRTENFPKLCFSRQQFLFEFLRINILRDCLTNQNINVSFFLKVSFTFADHCKYPIILDFLFVNWFQLRVIFSLLQLFLFSFDFDGKTQFSSLSMMNVYECLTLTNVDCVLQLTECRSESGCDWETEPSSNNDASQRITKESN